MQGWASIPGALLLGMGESQQSRVRCCPRSHPRFGGHPLGLCRPSLGADCTFVPEVV